MSEHTLTSLLIDARANCLTRREALKRAVALGLSAPMIAAVLAACGESSPAFTPTVGGPTTRAGGASPTNVGTVSTPPAAARTGRGGGGTLKLIFWQAPSTLNAHLDQGGGNVDAARPYAEPLADFNAKTELTPILAAEIPSIQNGGVARDSTSVTWKLRRDVKWHDGQPFTARDVAFTYKYLTDPATAATTLGIYQGIAAVDALDDATVRVTFKQPTAAWFDPFTNKSGQILPEHILKDYIGGRAKEAPFNLKPIGTGPYKVVSFAPGDAVIYEINQDYYEQGKPFFDRVELKGGGDAASAARAVLQTGDYDFAGNLQVEAQVLKGMEGGGAGKLVTWPGGGTEKLLINRSDPQTEQDGQRSYYQILHPHFQDLKVRQALALAIQRDAIVSVLYGPNGATTALTMNEVPAYMPKDLTWEYNPEKAKQLLDAAGAKPGPDGIRVLNGRKMSWLYRASTNSLRQKTQQIIKDGLKQVGIDVVIEAVDPSIFLSASSGNVNGIRAFYSDLSMESNGGSVFPISWYRRYLSANPAVDVAQKANNWATPNFQRYQNPTFNDLWARTAAEVDATKYTDLFLQMQRLVVNDVADIGLVARNNVAAAKQNLAGYEPTPWTSPLWDLKNWRRTT